VPHGRDSSARASRSADQLSNLKDAGTLSHEQLTKAMAPVGSGLGMLLAVISQDHAARVAAGDVRNLHCTPERTMKATLSLTLAAALVLTGTAFAQTAPPPNTTEDATPAAKTAAESRQSNAPSPGTVSPSSATDTGQSSTKSLSLACRKQASDKSLTRDDRAKFVEDCKARKTTPAGN
jgi:hypothetical protein